MRLGNILMFVAAIVCAATAALLARAWLNSQPSTERVIVRQPPKDDTRPVLVARRKLKFGAKVTPEVIRVVRWPSNAVPKGSFSDARQLFRAGNEPVALAHIEENEPILAHKISGMGEGSALAAKIGEAKKAVTIRVNDVQGVAGFVQPDDRVDVFLTRTERVQGKGGVDTRAYTVVLLQNMRVLAVDQLTERRTKASPAKAVTLEATTEEAQKLVLGGNIGQLSLALRRAGVAQSQQAKPIAIDDLLGGGEDARKKASEESGPVVGVTRAVERTEYKVREDDTSLWQQRLLRHSDEE